MRLLSFTLFMAYCLGTVWYVLTKHLTSSPDQFTFYNEYGLDTGSDGDNLIVVVYFMFTTLTTVGLGDFNPKSEIERLFISLILICGVLIFSWVMNTFFEILLNIKAVTS